MLGITRYKLEAQIAAQSKLSTEINRLNTNISTGVTIQKPSDDPVSASRVALIQRNQSNTDVWLKNIEVAAASSTQADVLMETLQNNLIRAKELMLMASNGTLNDTDRSNIALELSGIAEDMDSIAGSTDSRGKTIFQTGQALKIPISDTIAIQSTPTLDEIFGDLETADGPVGLTQIIRNAAAALLETDPELRATAIPASVTAVQQAFDHIVDQRSVQGVRAARVDTLREWSKTNESNLQIARSALEDTDVPATLIKVQAMMLALQASQATFSKMTQNGLFNYIN